MNVRTHARRSARGGILIRGRLLEELILLTTSANSSLSFGGLGDQRGKAAGIARENSAASAASCTCANVLLIRSRFEAGRQLGEPREIPVSL